MSKTLPCVAKQTVAPPACEAEGHGASGHSNNGLADSTYPFMPDCLWSIDWKALDKRRIEYMRFVKERMGANASLPPTDTDAPPPQRRSPRKSGLYAVLHSAQQHGFTPPSEGFWVMLPKEFDAILALEHKAVAQVVLEVLHQTIGKVGDGPEGRKEWARISQQHFARVGLMTNKAAWRGIEGALKKGYILRRKIGAQRYEYAIRWRGTN
jgi:hypothetical protein